MFGQYGRTCKRVFLMMVILCQTGVHVDEIQRNIGQKFRIVIDTFDGVHARQIHHFVILKMWFSETGWMGFKFG